MTDITENMFYEGIAVDIAFDAPGPCFGDLFQICGCAHPGFEPSGAYAFGKLVDLQFSQVDDYFGIKSLSEDGDDVVVWLFPLIDGNPVHHHAGPFDAIRLTFNVLRNPSRHVEHFLYCVSSFGAVASGVSPDPTSIRSDIDAITEYWRSNGIDVGSPEALEVDC